MAKKGMPMPMGGKKSGPMGPMGGKGGKGGKKGGGKKGC